MKLIKPMAYVNFTTMDMAIGFYLDKIPDGYEPIYTAEYVESLLDDLNNANKLQMNINKQPSPTPAEILAIRQAAGLTQAQAAARVYASSYRTWQDWERGVRTMPVAIWELWKLQDSHG